jgi:hypothetical protein
MDLLQPFNSALGLLWVLSIIAVGATFVRAYRQDFAPSTSTSTTSDESTTQEGTERTSFEQEDARSEESLSESKLAEEDVLLSLEERILEQRIRLLKATVDLAAAAEGNDDETEWVQFEDKRRVAVGNTDAIDEAVEEIDRLMVPITEAERVEPDILGLPTLQELPESESFLSIEDAVILSKWLKVNQNPFLSNLFTIVSRVSRSDRGINVLSPSRLGLRLGLSTWDSVVRAYKATRQQGYTASNALNAAESLLTVKGVGGTGYIIKSSATARSQGRQDPEVEQSDSDGDPS